MKIKTPSIKTGSTINVDIMDPALQDDIELQEFLANFYRADISKVKRFKRAKEAMEEMQVKATLIANEYEAALQALATPFFDVKSVSSFVSPKKSQGQAQ